MFGENDTVIVVLPLLSARAVHTLSVTPSAAAPGSRLTETRLVHVKPSVSLGGVEVELAPLVPLLSATHETQTNDPRGTELSEIASELFEVVEVATADA